MTQHPVQRLAEIVYPLHSASSSDPLLFNIATQFVPLEIHRSQVDNTQKQHTLVAAAIITSYLGPPYSIVIIRHYL